MHEYARQYGVSAVRPAGPLGPGFGMQTLPSSWQIAPLPEQPSWHVSPTPRQSAGRTQAGGAVVIGGPIGLSAPASLCAPAPALPPLPAPPPSAGGLLPPPLPQPV